MIPRYSLKTLQAIRRGLLSGQSMRVSVKDASGYLFSGRVINMGSLVSVQAEDGELVEDLRPEWVQHVWVTG